MEPEAWISKPPRIRSSSPTPWSPPRPRLPRPRRGRRRPHRRVGEGEGREGGVDFDGDYLLPGPGRTAHRPSRDPFHAAPRVIWRPGSAVIAYDAQIAAAGITTVFDSLPRRHGRAEARGGIGEQVSRSPRRSGGAPQAFCAPSTGRICAARFPRRTSSNLEAFLDAPSGAAGLADGPHAGPAAVPRPRQVFHLLPRQLRSPTSRVCRLPRERQRVSGERAGRTAARRRARAGAGSDAREPRRRHARDVEQARRDGVAIAEFPTTLGPPPPRAQPAWRR